MTTTIAVTNQKGGVAKTTTTAAICAQLKRRKFKTLAVDLDPQANLSDSVGAEIYNSPTIYEVLKNECKTRESIQKLDAFDIIPANIMLAGTELEFTQTGKEHMLKESLDAVLNDYDYVIIDTPPSLGVLTVNALTASDKVIIPTTAGIFATNGINQLYNTILNVKKYCNPDIKVDGILITRFNPRTTISKEMKELTKQLGEYINVRIYKTFIRNSVIVEEAQANKMDIFTYKENSTVAEDYNIFIDEFLKG